MIKNVIDFNLFWCDVIQIFEKFASLSFQVSSYEVKRSQRYLLVTIENNGLEGPIVGFHAFFVEFLKTNKLPYSLQINI